MKGRFILDHADATVCTTDRDFQFYRRNGRDPIAFVAPFVG